MRNSITMCRRTVSAALRAMLLFFVAACGEAEDAGETPAASADEANWRLVEAYIELDTAWHSKDAEIGRSGASSDEKDRMRREERGEHPDIVLAARGARAIIDAEGERAIDAAKFLVEHTPGLSPTVESDIAFGNAALARLIGPDWSVVAAYEDALQAWHDDDAERREAARAQAEETIAAESDSRPGSLPVGAQGVVRISSAFVFVPRPKVLEATAAVQAILDAGPDHEKAQDAARFLLENGTSNPHALLKGARAFVDNAWDFDDWPDVLMRLANVRQPDGSRPFDDFLDEFASAADDPVVRATARYFVASALGERVNKASADAADRESDRERALAMAISA